MITPDVSLSNHRSSICAAGVEVMTSIPNRYCQHLRIPAPCVEDVAGRPEASALRAHAVTHPALDGQYD
mgnify:CR=1 FL=1